MICRTWVMDSAPRAERRNENPSDCVSSFGRSWLLRVNELRAKAVWVPDYSGMTIEEVSFTLVTPVPPSCSGCWVWNDALPRFELFISGLGSHPYESVGDAFDYGVLFCSESTHAYSLCFRMYVPNDSTSPSSGRPISLRCFRAKIPLHDRRINPNAKVADSPAIEYLLEVTVTCPNKITRCENDVIARKKPKKTYSDLK